MLLADWDVRARRTGLACFCSAAVHSSCLHLRANVPEHAQGCKAELPPFERDLWRIILFENLPSGNCELFVVSLCKGGFASQTFCRAISNSVRGCGTVC